MTKSLIHVLESYFSFCMPNNAVFRFSRETQQEVLWLGQQSRLATSQKGCGSNLDSSSLHVEISFGKIQNPELTLMHLCECVRKG